MSMLVLASSSPRRIEMLRMVGLTHQVHPVPIDETPMPGELPEALVHRLSRAKAEAAAVYYPTQPVLGADTVVWAQGHLLGKPPHAGSARHMLGLLAGKTHTVWTGYCVRYVDVVGHIKYIQRAVATEVEVRAVREEEIAAYVHSEEWRGKAGGYAIQGRFSAFVRQIRGNYENVVGLPLCALLEDLHTAHLLPPAFPTWTPS